MEIRENIRKGKAGKYAQGCKCEGFQYFENPIRKTNLEKTLYLDERSQKETAETLETCIKHLRALRFSVSLISLKNTALKSVRFL